MKHRQFIGYSLLFLGGCASSQMSKLFNLAENNSGERFRCFNSQNQDYLLATLVTSKETRKYQGLKFVPVEDANSDRIRKIYERIGSKLLIQSFNAFQVYPNVSIKSCEEIKTENVY